jgi:hypothetical protein
LKKVICILIAICIVTGLSACGNEQSVAVEDRYVRGSIVGDTWTNQWLGISYTLTDGFSFTSEEKLYELMQITSDTIFEDDQGNSFVDYSMLDTVYEMMAYHNNGSNVVVISEMNMTGLTENEYMNYIRLQIIQAALEYNFTELYDFQLGSVSMKRCDGSTTAYGAMVYQTYLLYARGDRIISIVISSPHEDTVENIITSFG